MGDKLTRVYRVVVEPDEGGGYFAYAPSVPGVAEQGETVEEAFENMRVALEFHLESMIEEGEEVPQSDHEAGRLERDLELAF
jgi:predicted RNase H-like HicB family nuclease